MNDRSKHTTPLSRSDREPVTLGKEVQSQSHKRHELDRQPSKRRWWILAALGLALIVTWLVHAWLRSRLDIAVQSSAVQTLKIARAVATGLILAIATGLFGSKRAWTLDLDSEKLKEGPTTRLAQQQGYALWFVSARWIAAAAALGLLTLTEPDDRFLLFVWWGVLVGANVVFGILARGTLNPSRLITAQVIVDLVVLTGFLNASGGLENPLFGFYAFHTMICHILLPRKHAFGLTLVAAGLFLTLAFGEYWQILPHYTNLFFPHELPAIDEPLPVESHEAEHQSGGVPHASHDLFFVLGRTIPFLAVLLLTSYFTSIVMRSLRTREEDLELAALEARLEHQTLEGVVYASGVGMMQFLPNRELRWASDRVREWFDEERWQKGTLCPLGSGNGCKTCVVLRTVETRNSERAERTVDHDGHRRYFRHSSTPILNPDGEVVQVVEVIEDITATKALEEEAIRSGKLSVLARMAAGIAHEVGNPLSSMSTRIALLERKRDSEFVGESVVALREQVERISQIVHGVSQFSRGGSSRRQNWDINSLIAETLSIVKLDQQCRNVKFIFEPQGALSVFVERDHIVQILLNLLLNAAEAGPQPSKIEVGSRFEDPWVSVTVTDHGLGIPAEAREHLFEPFFSTKAKGTGLGLAICLGLANAQGGHIEVENNSPGGASFTLVLPGATSSATGRPSQPLRTSPGIQPA